MLFSNLMLLLLTPDLSRSHAGVDGNMVGMLVRHQDEDRTTMCCIDRTGGLSGLLDDHRERVVRSHRGRGERSHAL